MSGNMHGAFHVAELVDLTFTPLVHVESEEVVIFFRYRGCFFFFLTRGNLSETEGHACGSALSSSVSSSCKLESFNPLKGALHCFSRR